MKKLLLFINVFCAVGIAKSQQIYFMSQYMQQHSMYNPAAAGLSGRNFVGASYRSMWASFPGNPKTTVAYGDFELKNLNAGIAAYLYKDQTGATSRNGLQFAYSYHIHSKDNKNHFGLGLELRAMQFALDQSKITEALGSIDPILSGSKSKFAVDAGAGAYWTNGKTNAGLAVTQLISSKLNLASDAAATSTAKLYRQYNFLFSHKFQTGDDIFIIPNALLRVSQNAPTELDFGAKFDYQDKMWWAMNMRMNQFWSIQAGLKIKNKIRVTYSYDFYTSPASVFEKNSGANEIGLQFDFSKK